MLKLALRAEAQTKEELVRILEDAKKEIVDGREGEFDSKGNAYYFFPSGGAYGNS